MRTASRGSVPWRLSDAAIVSVSTFIGLATVIFGWYGVSGTDRLSAQMEWADAAVGGALVAATGNVMWILSGRRAVGLRRAAQTDRLNAFVDAQAALPVVVDTQTAELMALTGFVVLRGMTLYHRPDCRLVGGRRVTRFNPSNRRSRRPCGVCLP